ncbi:ferredoxin [Mycolicibacterium mengxianglii]|uniref:ferredoxin n=1 Tax=Mycolicibacterium mengxianglii TaxID=2736649 RepID=UPI0018D09E4B|nr:ferredoxin [Mycolicibacterium mengxianglii]
MSDGMRIRLDRTLCDGFGMCARHAPQYFSLDDWGYASLEGSGRIPEADRDAVTRALLDCPVHAIIAMPDPHDDAGSGTTNPAVTTAAPTSAR